MSLAPMAAIVDLASSAQQLQQAMEVAEEEAKAAEQQQRLMPYSSSILMKGVRHLSDSGITRLPDRYVLPAPDRPDAGAGHDGLATTTTSVVKV